MIVGYEWIIDAEGCDADALRDTGNLRSIFASVIADLQLKTIGEAAWHKFGGEGGVTGMVMLTESHLACHTYPEHNAATFNLYCCRERPNWKWEENLREKLGAESIKIQKVERGSRNAGILPAVPEASRFQTNFPKVNYGEVKIRNRGRLPHWEKDDGIYFVTFRLADSLPKETLQKLKYERDLTISVLEKRLLLKAPFKPTRSGDSDSMTSATLPKSSSARSVLATAERQNGQTTTTLEPDLNSIVPAHDGQFACNTLINW